jgi:hypothetical protein
MSKVCGKEISMGQGPNEKCGGNWGGSIIQCERCKGFDEGFQEAEFMFKNMNYSDGVNKRHLHLVRESLQASQDLLSKAIGDKEYLYDRMSRFQE